MARIEPALLGIDRTTSPLLPMASSFAWLDTALSVQGLCEERQFPFAFIGGVAVQRWGEPRVTQDVDLTLFTGFGGEEPFIKSFLERFDPRIPDAAEFALNRRVLLIQSKEGIPVDVALGGFPFEEEMTRRATYADYYANVRLKTCSAEDLVVLKAFAARPQDWLDIERIITRQTGKLDWRYIRSHLKPLAELKQAPAILDELEKRRIEFEQ